VGKTFSMLEEAHRLHDAGADVVIGVVESHGRQATAGLIEGLETVPLRSVLHRGVELTELDAEAVLRRAPAIAVIDELAHSNAPGSERQKRWMDVHVLLDAGIDVMTTVNIQHIESLTDVVDRITGTTQRETVPDAVLREADRIELVDIAPQALRDRLADGLVYPAERIDAALGNYFRLGNLTALRELALLWLADEVDDALRRYRSEKGIDDAWETRERVVVAVTGGPEGAVVIRRAARIAARSRAAELLAVHVSEPDGLTQPSSTLEADERLVRSLGGSFHRIQSASTASALLEFARGVNASQLVIGVSRHSRFSALVGSPGVSGAVVRMAGDIDVHIVPHGERRSRRLPTAKGALSWKRRMAGFVLMLVLLPTLTAVLGALRTSETLVTDVLAFQTAIVVIALVGGIWPAVTAAVAGGALLNFFFIDPLYTFTATRGRDLVAVGLFIAVAIMVSVVVDQAARRSRAARRSAAEARTLVSIAGAVISGADALAALVDRLRETFGFSSVLLLESGEITSSSRDPAIARESDVETVFPVGDGASLYIRGAPMSPSERTIVGAFVAQVAAALTQRRLAVAAESAEPLAEADRMRSALLAAVGHDVRRPLAAATAAVSSLAATDVQLSADDRSELLRTAEDSLDALTGLLTDLLDVSRLQAGVLGVQLTEVDAHALIGEALDELGLGPGAVTIELAEVPPLTADPVLARRALVNVLANALRYSPPDTPPLVSVSAWQSTVQIRVVDRGPGLRPEEKARAFLPFQRTTDTDNTAGLGLGLALSRGFAEAMGGSLDAEDTPGGGLTVVLVLATREESA
jgi:two-component system sensor histidine kinase KdpD